ncbi:MAG: RimK-like protein [Firmicutes bacterium]|nr:RimK-like protein [Bacillota bacterium]
MNSISYLVISNTIDFSTDLVCLQLQKLGKRYLRVNRDKFFEYKITYKLNENAIFITMCDENYVIRESELKSIFFRAPVFLRNGKTYSVSEQLYRSQWSAFIRNLIVFDKSKWINNPVDTYKAENKMYQLKLARDNGLVIPKTLLGNCISEDVIEDNEYIIKALDTALFHDGDVELFTYSTIVTGLELKCAELSSAPVIIQEHLKDKIDIRVTIIGEKIFPVKITRNGHGIVGDWRKTSKELLSYTPFELPVEVSSKLIVLMKQLNLLFGGIDLIFCNDKYYFVEVNPTGEWGWLKFATKINLEEEIVNCMLN